MLLRLQKKMKRKLKQLESERKDENQPPEREHGRGYGTTYQPYK